MRQPHPDHKVRGAVPRPVRPDQRSPPGPRLHSARVPRRDCGCRTTWRWWCEPAPPETENASHECWNG
eukprot:5892121-Lingulodinium_polyedra.AAC.1